jgi:PEGA domain
LGIDGEGLKKTKGRPIVKSLRKTGVLAFAVLPMLLLLKPATSRGDNKVMGRVDFVPAGNAEKSAGVWVDGQYVGFVNELKGDKKVMLLPGDHEITVRQTGYAEWKQKITVQPAQTLQLTVKLEKDLRFQYPAVTSEVKLKVEPDRAAVFVDGNFVGYVHQFGGVGRAMLVAPGKHQIKIALVGYRDFTTEVNLQPNQKFTLKTELQAASVDQADPAVKKD